MRSHYDQVGLKFLFGLEYRAGGVSTSHHKFTLRVGAQSFSRYLYEPSSGILLPLRRQGFYRLFRWFEGHRYHTKQTYRGVVSLGQARSKVHCGNRVRVKINQAKNLLQGSDGGSGTETQDRSPRRAKHMFSDTSNEQAIDACPLVSRHSNQIDVKILCGLFDYLGGPSDLHKNLVAHLGQMFSRDLLQPQFVGLRRNLGVGIKLGRVAYRYELDVYQVQQRVVFSR